MPLPTPETQAKVVSEAAQNFVDTFYEVLNRRHQLAPYYASISPKLTSASLVPDISINGTHVTSVPDLESLLEKQGSPVHYEVHSFDAQPVNPCFALGAPDAMGGASAGNSKEVEKGDRISFAVQVSGTVKFGKGEGAVERGFNEAFVLVPHWEASGRHAPRGLRRWVIVSQNQRIL